MEKQNFYDLDVWKKSVIICKDTYILTKKFPRSEIFGIIDQLKRAVTSISANIAEGYERYYYADKVRYYYQARGSISEVQCFLLLSIELGYIENKDQIEGLWRTLNEIIKMLNGLIRYTKEHKNS